MPREHDERWGLVDNLREGGQAYVHLVQDSSNELDGLFVLKRLKNPGRLNRFQSEVATLKELDHPGIVKLIDYDLEVERPWFVQEYCKGGDLREFVESGRLRGPDQCFEFIIQISDALAYAHGMGRIHRDLKPENIVLRGRNGPAVLADFGLIFPGESENDRITLTFEQVGSRFYMAPELGDGRLEDVHPSCDIYSLGKVLYFMLSNGHIFDREGFETDRNDLVQRTGNVFLEHANNLLRRMITLDPESRGSAASIAEEARKARNLIDGRYPSLEGRHWSPCKYCGHGWYSPVAGNLSEYMEFTGFLPSAVSQGGADFRIMACDNCGNLQVFNMKVLAYDWWPEEGLEIVPKKRIEEPESRGGFLVPSLPDHATRLLLEAQKDSSGTISTFRTLTGWHVQTNGVEFVSEGNPRSEAKWEQALRLLHEEGLVRLSDPDTYQVTAEGYELADSLGSG